MKMHQRHVTQRLHVFVCMRVEAIRLQKSLIQVAWKQVAVNANSYMPPKESRRRFVFCNFPVKRGRGALILLLG